MKFIWIAIFLIFAMLLCLNSTRWIVANQVKGEFTQPIAYDAMLAELGAESSLAKAAPGSDPVQITLIARQHPEDYPL